ncbi:MAG: R.Pab1 family restriction endonuclease [Anaerolineae bacterium]|nr:R.Pab1 family restriction endonuclease [Anaerolineae bacterium]
MKRKGQPIATRQVPLQADDELEWQISYQNPDGGPVELGEWLRLAYEYELLSREDIRQLHSLVLSHREFFDEIFAIEEELASREFEGFKLQWRKHPMLRRELWSEDGLEATIMVELRHRQRAVGFQAMVFLLIPLQRCDPADLIGRPAKPKEVAYWSPSREILIALIHAFSISSRSHQKDIAHLLKRLIGHERWIHHLG